MLNLPSQVDTSKHFCSITLLTPTSCNIYYISSENAAPRQYIGEQDVVGLCMGSVSGMAMTWNQRGYAPEDTTGGPWRAWAGGNS